MTGPLTILLPQVRLAQRGKILPHKGSTTTARVLVGHELPDLWRICVSVPGGYDPYPPLTACCTNGSRRIARVSRLAAGTGHGQRSQVRAVRSKRGHRLAGSRHTAMRGLR